MSDNTGLIAGTIITASNTTGVARWETGGVISNASDYVDRPIVWRGNQWDHTKKSISFTLPSTAYAQVIHDKILVTLSMDAVEKFVCDVLANYNHWREE